MSAKPAFSFGANAPKKAGPGKPPPAKRKPVFGQSDDDSDDEGAGPNSNGGSKNKPPSSNVEAIAELDDSASTPLSSRPAEGTARNGKRTRDVPPTVPPKSKPGAGPDVMLGDLSSTREAQKHAEAAMDIDPTIYDYDAVYDSLKPQRQRRTPVERAEDAERRPKYMGSLLAAAAVRKRDALIAEEKKVARERKAEGNAFADKERFVTEAYREQQEENRRLEEEERRREEEEAKKNETGGMSAFYKKMLDKGDRRHAELMKAAEDMAKRREAGEPPPEDEQPAEKSENDIAREINEKGGSIAINEDGQVVDKRQLLRGGLNVVAKKPSQATKRDAGPSGGRGGGYDRDGGGDGTGKGSGKGFVGSGGRNAMRERQSRMMEEQLDRALKRSRAAEEEEREKVERATKTRKTESEIEGARERYLRRKREAEEANERGGGDS